MNNTIELPYTLGSFTSNGTTIGYRKVGRGDAVILLHAGMQAAQHQMKLAAALADIFTVYLPDRRERGMSGGRGANYSMATECEDVAALVAETGATRIYGHSSGGLIALQAALTLPAIRKVAVYEPPLSQNGSISTAWLPRFNDEIAKGKNTDALITAIGGLNLSPAFRFIPRWLMVPLLRNYLKSEKQATKANEIAMEDLVATQALDMQLVQDMDSRLATFATLSADLLLLGGEKSPKFLRDILDALDATVPHAQKVIFARLNHDGPTEKAPETVGATLRTFFQS